MSSRTYLTRSFEGWKLIRKCLVQIDELVYDFENCAKCDFCSLICPREALSFQTKSNGARKQLEINPKECVYCGYCVAFCPFHALELRINGESTIPVIEQGLFFPLIRDNQVCVPQKEAEKYCPTCHICVTQCPRDAISMSIIDGIPKIIVDFKLCAGCKSCSLNCPVKIIETDPVFVGQLDMDIQKLQPFGKALVEICPMECFALNDDFELIFSKDSCNFCGACQYIPGAPSGSIVVRRTKMKTDNKFSETVTNAIKEAFLTG